MKILHILADMYTGGAQKFCIDTCNELAKDENNEVILCSIEKLTPEQDIMHKKIDSRVKFISLDKEGKSPLIIYDIAKMIFSVKPDITHTHTRAQLYASLGLVMYGKPNIHTVHSMANKELSQGRLKIHNYLYDFFNFTPVSISDKVLESVQSLYGDKYNIKIDNGVKVLSLTDKYNETKKFINSLKKDKNTKIFVSVGRCYDVKNQKLLVESFEALLKEGVDAHLLILGSLDVVPEYAKSCLEKIKSKGNIHLLGEKSNVADFLSLSDALCFTSKYEGFPMAIIEAMSLGIPTISTPVGGIVDIISDGHTGYLSKDMSVQAYKDVLKRAILEPSIDKEFLKNHFIDNYTIEQSTQQYMKLYEEKVA